MRGKESNEPSSGNATAILLALAAARLALTLAFSGNYGYFRNELYYIACSDHLAFGYVDQPPLSIALLATVLMAAFGALTAPYVIPVLPVETYVAYQESLGIKPAQEERIEAGVLPQHYADMFGWEEMTAKVAEVYQSLSPAERAGCLIYVRNYGQAGPSISSAENTACPRPRAVTTTIGSGGRPTGTGRWPSSSA